MTVGRVRTPASLGRGASSPAARTRYANTFDQDGKQQCAAQHPKEPKWQRDQSRDQSWLAHLLALRAGGRITHHLPLRAVALTARYQNERLQATLIKAVHEAIRASKVLRRLRDFYQTGTIEREAVHVATVCNAVAITFRDRMQRSSVQFFVAVPSGCL